MIHQNIVIAGVRISFWTNHPADIACIEDIFLYHPDRSDLPIDAKNRHDVVIMSGFEKIRLPTDYPLVWKGLVNQQIPVCWYNPTDRGENVVIVDDGILIRYFVEKKLTVCYLSEIKTRFGKSHRPLLENCIFFLIQSVLSMHGRYSLHASCVSKNGYALLFPGKSGEGKTTISVILGEAGYEYMGDDLVFISQDEAGEVMINGFLTKIKLFNPKSKEKETVDVIKDRRFKYATQSKLGAIINLRRACNSKKSTLIPTSTQTETFSQLINAGNNIVIQYRPDLWMNICERASLAPSFALVFGDKDFFDPAILEAI